MPTITDYAGYWNHYATGVAEKSAEDALKYAFGWTQYDGHGPGDELLGDPDTALELGSGRGNAVAALATKGVDAIGLDISDVQCAQARQRWGHLRARFAQGDAVEFLSSSDERWDTIYSIWGAAWFTDPDRLFPLVHDRLTSDGRFVFSHAQAVPGSYGIQGTYAAGLAGRQVWAYRWAYEPEDWTEILRRHGFRNVHAWHEPAPDPENVSTLIAEAQR